MTFEGYLVIALLLIAGGITARVLFPKVRLEPVGPTIRANELQDQRIRAVAKKAAETAEIAMMPREVAQEHIEKLVWEAVAKEYAKLHPGIEVQATEHWPVIVCILVDNTAIIEIWVGHSLDREGIKPVFAEVKRPAVLKLDTRRPIREAFEERYTPPPKAAATASKPGAGKAPAKPTPPKRTLK